jgi:lysophospholipid hydrolase
MHTEDFDLREEVMSCIAKSIGLLQPPLTEVDSTSTSPSPFTESFNYVKLAPSAALFNPSFSSLLRGDDATSSMSSGVVSSSPGAATMNGLDNEVEILFFPAGSTIVKAKEKNAGKKSR